MAGRRSSLPAPPSSTASAAGRASGTSRKTRSSATYSIRCAIPGLSSEHGYAGFNVEEYRVPLFEVELADESEVGDTARVRIQSNYFHGGANAGAQVSWTADWSRHYYNYNDKFKRGDRYSENPTRVRGLPDQSGKLKLGADGGAYIENKLPADRPFNASRYALRLSVDVTSPEGRSISTGLYNTLQVLPHDSGLRMAVSYEAQPKVLVEIGAFDIDDRPSAGLPAELKLFLVESKTVKEKVAPGVFRYRNFEQFHEVFSAAATTGKVFEIPAAKPGRYVAVVRLLDYPDAPTHSQRVTVAGEKPASYPVLQQQRLRHQG